MNTIFNDHQIAAVYIAMITMNVFVNVINMQECSGLLYIIIMCSYAYTNYIINGNVYNTVIITAFEIPITIHGNRMLVHV